jgi:pimeloyl-ACP methyl ester carboxylesterase
LGAGTYPNLAPVTIHWVTMPLLHRPDDAEIHWEEAGDGAPVLVANVLHGHPGMIGGLARDLSSDHRVITYDLRGTGASSRRGPYDPAVDAADLEALLEHVGGVAVAVAIGDASLRAVRMAVARPDLVDAVLAPGTFLLGAATARGSEALTGSRSVLKALVTLLETDYRAGIRSMVASSNPNLSEDEMRERVDLVVAHCEQEAAVSRIRSWIRDDATDAARALGDRLRILHYPGNPWFPPELAEQMPEVLPDAGHEAVADGPMSRPELTAAVVRRITANRHSPLADRR